MTAQSPASEAFIAARLNYIQDQAEVVKLRQEKDEAIERWRSAEKRLEQSGPAFRKAAEQYADALLTERTNHEPR